MKKEAEKLTLEENFARLEEMIERLGEEDIPLEEAFETYAEGMRLLGQCNEQIDKVEKQVLKYRMDGQLEEFADGDEDV